MIVATGYWFLCCLFLYLSFHWLCAARYVLDVQNVVGTLPPVNINDVPLASSSQPA